MRDGGLWVGKRRDDGVGKSKTSKTPKTSKTQARKPQEGGVKPPLHRKEKKREKTREKKARRKPAPSKAEGAAPRASHQGMGYFEVVYNVGFDWRWRTYWGHLL